MNRLNINYGAYEYKSSDSDSLRNILENRRVELIDHVSNDAQLSLAINCQ